MRVGLLAFVRRVNAAHPWSHNDAFSKFVLRHARVVRSRGGSVALDVGCGTGDLLIRLAEVFPTVIGIEPHPETASHAIRRFTESRVRVDERQFGAEPPHAYDLIVFVASLHHMPLRTALQDARAALRPGGRVVIVGLARETPRDAMRSWLSFSLNPLVGLLRHPSRATETPTRMQAPIADARESFDEIRAIAAAILPGTRMRRRLFWRYTASWTAPR